jgi:hypothetical protein
MPTATGFTVIKPVMAVAAMGLVKRFIKEPRAVLRKAWVTAIINTEWSPVIATPAVQNPPALIPQYLVNLLRLEVFALLIAVA